MHSPPNPPVLYSFSSTDDVVQALANFILKAQKDALEKKDRFTIALSGGSLPKMLKGLIDLRGIKWDKWYAMLSRQRDPAPLLSTLFIFIGKYSMPMRGSFPSIIQTRITLFANWSFSPKFQYQRPTFTQSTPH
jgi:Glucosamine-6-phosphate isomerases/6-phosphogluconolactonase